MKLAIFPSRSAAIPALQRAPFNPSVAAAAALVMLAVSVTYPVQVLAQAQRLVFDSAADPAATKPATLSIVPADSHADSGHVVEPQPIAPASQPASSTGAIALELPQQPTQPSVDTGTEVVRNLIDFHQQVRQWNAQLAAQQSLTQAAETLNAQARATLLPQVDVQYSWQRQRDDRSQGSNPAFPDFSASYRASNGAVIVNQRLFNAEALAGLRQARAQISQSQAELIQFEQDLLLSSALAWFELANAISDQRFTAAEVEALNKQLQRVEAEYELGAVAKLSVQETAARSGLVQVQHLQAQQRLRQAREQLYELSGLSNVEPGVLATEPVKLVDLSMETALQTGKLTSPEYLLAQLNNQIADTVLARQRASRLPTVNAFLQQSLSDNTESPFGQRVESRVYGLRVDVPLFAGGLRNAQVDEAKARRDASGYQQLAVERQISRQIRGFYLDVESSFAQISALRSALLSSKTALQVSQAAAEEGLRTTADVLDSRSTVLRAQRDLLAARYQHLTAQLRLLRSMGALHPQIFGRLKQSSGMATPNSHSSGN